MAVVRGLPSPRILSPKHRVRADTQKLFTNVSTNDNYIGRGLAPFEGRTVGVGEGIGGAVGGL